jgi:hypothetical protein
VGNKQIISPSFPICLDVLQLAHKLAMSITNHPYSLRSSKAKAGALAKNPPCCEGPSASRPGYQWCSNWDPGIDKTSSVLPLSRYHRAKLNNLYQILSNYIKLVYQWPSLENTFPIFRQTYFTICQGSSSRNSNRGISELSLISARSASVISPHFLMESDGRSTRVNLCQLNVMYTETWLKLLDFQLS